MKEKYGLYQRIVKKKKVWYFWYYPEENSSKRIQKSSGKTTKWEAKQYVEQFFHKIEKSKEKAEKILTFKDFTEDFFVWDKCDWIRGQHDKGKKFDVSVAKMRRGHLNNYLWPEFGDEPLGTESKKLNAVYIEKWLSQLSLANQTKNHILFSFRIIMRWAKKQRIIPYNPLEDTEPLSTQNYKRKDILSLKELKTLFPADILELKKVWGDTYFSALFLLMITTGMRAQEIRALMWTQILWDEKIILIDRAVKLHGEIGTLKSDYNKATFIPDRTAHILEEWKKETPYKDDYDLVFFGEDGNTPLSRDRINDVLDKRLKLFSDIAKGKRITPHCFRTTYNTLMRKNIPETLLRLQLGHKSVEMTDRYDREKIIAKLSPFKNEKDTINKVFLLEEF